MAVSLKPNLKQQECIDNTEGKYLVLAGPGTGKTFTMIQRIKAMIEKGIEPSKILCLTFSDAATNEVKTRLEKELHKADTGVNVYTYHGFCNEILSENPVEFELPENIRKIPDAAAVSLLKECIDEIDSKVYRTKRNDPYYFIGEIQKGIEAIKMNRLSKENYFNNIETNPDWKPQLIALKNELSEKTEQGKKITQKLLDGIDRLEKKIAKAQELWKFYELYRSKMEELHYFDFNDSITHIILSTKEQALPFPPLSHTASHVQVLSEDELWRCISNHTPLPLSKPHRSHPLRIPSVLYRPVASSPLFAGFLFLLYLPHP